MQNTSKLRIVMWLLVLLAIIISIVVYVVIRNQNIVVSNNAVSVKKNFGKIIEHDKSMKDNLSNDALSSTQKLVDEIKNKKINLNKKGKNNASSTMLSVVNGASNIDTRSGVVVSQDGTQVDNTAEPGDYKAPQESFPIVDKNEIPKTGVSLVMKSDGIAPVTFTVKQNQVVSLTVSAGDKWTHVFRFKDESLKAVAVGVGPFETRSIVFNAPRKAGDYVFYDDVGNFAKKGAKGIMKVIK